LHSISKANSNWKDIDAETIEILPNGFITDATISLSQDDELISFKTIEDETK
jgi:aspartyl/asparaginyl beta-hydroxylase (cupin superfamily)